MYIVFDTETAGDIKKPLIYDLGWVICNDEGVILKKQNFLIKEIFCNLQLYTSAYYSYKFGLYCDMLQSQKIFLVSFNSAIKELLQDIKNYNIKNVFAYNIAFDVRAIKYTNKHINGFYNDLFARLKVIDIWASAWKICTTKKYYNYCINNNYITDSGKCIKTSAEIVYRYLLKNDNFTEAHQALDDAIIENEILKVIKKRHLKLKKPCGYNYRLFQVK